MNEEPQKDTLAELRESIQQDLSLHQASAVGDLLAEFLTGKPIPGYLQVLINKESRSILQSKLPDIKAFLSRVHIASTTLLQDFGYSRKVYIADTEHQQWAIQMRHVVFLGYLLVTDSFIKEPETLFNQGITTNEPGQLTEDQKTLGRYTYAVEDVMRTAGLFYVYTTLQQRLNYCHNFLLAGIRLATIPTLDSK